MRLTFVVTLVVVWVSPTFANPVSQARWPAEVQAAHQENVSACSEQRGRLSVDGAEYVVTGDFNADGRPDYLVNSNFLRCSSAASLYCGSLGCNVNLLLSQPDGRLQEDEAIITPALEILREGGRDYVRFGTREGWVTWGWNGREFTPMNAAQMRAVGNVRPSLSTSGTGRTEQLAESGNWIVARSPQGNLFAHSLSGAGAVETVGLTCIGGQPHLMALLPGYRGSSAIVRLETDGGRVETALRPRGTGWISTEGNPLLAGLIGGDARDVQVSLNGRSIGRVSLIGSRRAVGEALASCWQLSASPAPSANGSGDAELRAQVNALFGTAGDGAQVRFTPSLDRILTRYNETAEGDGWGNWICACQDVESPRTTISRVRISGDRAEVDAAYSDFGATHPRRILFIRQGGRWLIDDVIAEGVSIRVQHANP